MGNFSPLALIVFKISELLSEDGLKTKKIKFKVLLGCISSVKHNVTSKVVLNALHVRETLMKGFWLKSQQVCQVSSPPLMLST